MENNKDNKGNPNIHQGHRGPTTSPSSSPLDASWSYVSKKSEKLTTALYMVTDIMPVEEPMKWKMRQFGVGLLSDVMLYPTSSSVERGEILRRVLRGVEHIVSYLDVSWTTRMMTEMNANILKKEYLGLKDIIVREIEKTSASGTLLAPAFFDVPHTPSLSGTEANDSWKSKKELPLESASTSPSPAPSPSVVARQGGAIPESSSVKTVDSQSQTTPEATPQSFPIRTPDSELRNASRSFTMRGESRDGGRNFVIQKDKNISQGQTQGQQSSSPRVIITRSSEARPNDNDGSVSRAINGSSPLRPKESESKTAPVVVSPASSELRTADSQLRTSNNDRRKIILALVRQKPSLTVKDIARSITGYSEKTIQRELLAMVAEGTLIKKGDRRWSTYSLNA